jgi:aspartate ammonia-lyase
LREQFVTDFIPGGAGTSRRMNANEVIANVALEHLDHKKGRYQYVSPNDYVNFGRSTNDVYPTAFRLALMLRLGSYVKDMPVTVAVDPTGHSIHETRPTEWRAKIGKIPVLTH